MTQRRMVTGETLKAILDAFNAHDLDSIMGFFADDCSLDMHAGQSRGAALQGQASRPRGAGGALQGSAGRPLR